ncbi:MAG: thioesterase [Alphaproteobacteria bacterium MedPE-SWcel]|nr:MAG: thioesterase [Alphaproteobacteria bacterium MedPE-SWcel]
MELVFDAQELAAYLEEVFPQIRGDFTVEALSRGSVSMRLNVQEQHLRPGGTVSGPSMFALADVSVYALVLAHLGREALAVTTNASLDFMRKPEAGRDLIGQARLLKLGRSLAVGDVLVFSEGMEQPVARSTMTYSIPPAR